MECPQRTVSRASIVLIAALAVIGLSSCGGPGGGGSGPLLNDVSIDLANYLVLDLTTGQIDARSDVPDLATNPAYRTTKMVFRTVTGGTATLGQASGTFCAQPDETPTTVTMRKFYIGVFDVTQGQWLTLVGTTPWSAVVSTAVVGGVTTQSDLPAFNISYAGATQMTVNTSSRMNRSLSLPTPQQWEFACRGGNPGIFFWGSSRDDTVVANYAEVGETAAGRVGPLPVGSLSPNGYGLYDMEGNVWEITSDGSIRGGSWSDTLAQARCANGQVLDSHTAHALVGVRLVLNP